MGRTVLVSLGLLAAVAGGFPARAQMEVQRQLWRCQEDARDRGLAGAASEAHVNRCLDGAGVSQQPPEQGRPARRAPGPATTASAWRLTTPTAVQVTLSLTSTDRAFGWSFDCTNSMRPGSSVFTTFFTYPRGATVYGYTTAILIDGVTVPIEVDGSEGGVSLTDATVSGWATLSPRTRQMLADGTTLRIPVRTRAGGRRDAVFNLAGGRGAFEDFERRCRSLR